MNKPTVDIITQNAGIMSLTGVSTRGCDWLATHVVDDSIGFQVSATTLTRYAETDYGCAIIRAAIEEGLIVQDAASGRIAVLDD